jgi:drug/metabolite transporter (DMT)-like permease
VEILLALGAAASYGTADFAGGRLTKKVGAVVVVLFSQVAAFVLLLGLLAVWKGSFSGSAIVWGTTAGAAVVVGTCLLYRGLAIGRVSVVAPITAVLAAGIPALFGVAVGERPGPAAVLGGAIGLFAVVTITRAPQPVEATTSASAAGQVGVVHSRRSQRGVPEALGAGVGFGLFFVLLDRSPDDSGIWPLVATRISEIAIAGAIVALGRLSVELRSGTALRLFMLGFVNVAADIFYLLATREGLLSLVAVITSMYPAVTVVLARVVLSERVLAQQSVGLALAGASVVLIATG